MRGPLGSCWHQLPTLLCAIGTLVAPALQANTNQVFNIIPAGQPGGCDAASLAAINPMLNGAAQMAGAAITALNTALNGPSTPIIDKSKRAERRRIVDLLNSLFGVTVSSGRMKVNQPETVTTIRDNLQKVVDLNNQANQNWRLACSDGWLQPRTTTVDYDPDNDPAGQSMAIDKKPGYGLNDFVWWDDYGVRDPNNIHYVNPLQWPRPPGVQAWTQAGICHDFPRLGGEVVRLYSIIYFCPNFFSGQFPQFNGQAARTVDTTFRQQNNNFAVGTTLDTAYSTTSLFLHEMMHYTNQDIHDEVGYGFQNCQNGKGQGTTNADSYALLATAYWFNQFNWASSTAQTPAA